MDWELGFGIDYSTRSFRERDIQLVRLLCAGPAATAIKSRIRPDIRKQRGFEQKAAKIAKMDWELGFGIDYSTRSFREPDIQLVRLLLSRPGHNRDQVANQDRPKNPNNFQIFASFATFCSNSLCFLLFHPIPRYGRGSLTRIAGPDRSRVT